VVTAFNPPGKALVSNEITKNAPRPGGALFFQKLTKISGKEKKWKRPLYSD